MSQPPLSAAIRSLEQELGFALLNRTTRSVALTPAGATLQAEGVLVMQALEQAVESARRVAEGVEGRLRVGFVGIATELGLPEMIRTFRTTRPHVELKLEELTPPALQARLLKGSLDIAFLRGGGPPHTSLTYRPFASEGYHLAIPSGHGLSGKPKVHIKELQGEPLLFFPRSFHPALYDAWLSAFHHAAATPRLVQEVRSLRTELALVKSGLGLALVGASVAARPLDGVEFLPLSGKIPHIEVEAVFKQGEPSRLLQSFLAELPQ